MIGVPAVQWRPSCPRLFRSARLEQVPATRLIAESTPGAHAALAGPAPSLPGGAVPDVRVSLHRWHATWCQFAADCLGQLTLSGEPLDPNP